MKGEIKWADPYPLMFSMSAEDKPKEELPELYSGGCYFQYKYKEENFYDDSNFFGNPFQDDFKSQRESEEEENENYKILGLKKSASDEDIKQAFRDKARETHPDKGGTPEDFREVREAYESLI
jgi:hypothetical protein